jgi:hypothetical protein
MQVPNTTNIGPCKQWLPHVATVALQAPPGLTICLLRAAVQADVGDAQRQAKRSKARVTSLEEDNAALEEALARERSAAARLRAVQHHGVLGASADVEQEKAALRRLSAQVRVAMTAAPYVCVHMLGWPCPGTCLVGMCAGPPADAQHQ